MTNELQHNNHAPQAEQTTVAGEGPINVLGMLVFLKTDTERDSEEESAISAGPDALALMWNKMTMAERHDYLMKVRQTTHINKSIGTM